MGDYLRELCDSGTHTLASFDCDKIRDHLRDSKLLPAEVLIPVLLHRLSSTPGGNSTTTAWLIDGFPRNVETALAFEEKARLLETSIAAFRAIPKFLTDGILQVGKPVKVISLSGARDIAQCRFQQRGRERGDDEERFAGRYNEYLGNMEALNGHYRSMTKTVRDGAVCTLVFLADKHRFEWMELSKKGVDEFLSALS